MMHTADQRLPRPHRAIGRITWLLAVMVSIAANLGLASYASAQAGTDNIPRPPRDIDGRAYELVSQAQKNGNHVNVAVISSDGDRALYQLLSGGVPGSTSGVATLAAQRTPTGWVSHNALPPRLDMLKSNYFLEAATPDVEEWIAAAKDGIGGTSGSPGVGLARLSEGGAQTVLHEFPTSFGPTGVSVVASDDLQHVFVASPEVIDPSHATGTSNVYDFAGASPVLVSRLPETDQAPACGVQPSSATMDFPGGAFNAVSEHWSSTDGSRVFFSTRGDVCADERQLYMRNLSDQTTTLISGSPIAGAPENGIDRFLQATPDGSQAFFRTATSLSAADDDDGNDTDRDIYRWLADGHQLTCVTCQIPNADVPQASGRFSNAAISEDGSHVYFPSAAQGADAPTAGDGQNPNLYLWTASDESVRFIAQINVSGIGVANWVGAGGQTTVDGDVLLFRATGTDLDQRSGSSNNGFKQYYRYDARDRSITCVSCVAGVEPTIDTDEVLTQPFPPVFARAYAMTADGSMVFFVTSDALVPHDVNEGPDIYEWHAGVTELITTGHTLYPPFATPVPVSVSADGRDFFFLDLAHLTSEAEDGGRKLYDARIGGGFPPATPTAECDGEQCQSPPALPPALVDPGSLLLRSPSTGASKKRSSTTLVVARVSRAQRARFAATARLTLSIRVRPASRLSVVAKARLEGSDEVVARSARSVRPGVARLTLRLSRAAQQTLAERGRMRVVVRVHALHPSRSKQLVLPLKHRASADEGR